MNGKRTPTIKSNPNILKGETSLESSSQSYDPSKGDEVESMDWYEYFLKKYEALLTKHITDTWQRCRVLVLSGTDLRDTYENDGEMNTVISDEELRNEFAYKIDKNKAYMLQNQFYFSFKVLDMGKYFQDFGSMDQHDIAKCKNRMFEDIQNLMPTLIVLPFQAIRFSVREQKGDIIETMMKSDNDDILFNKETEWDGMNGLVACDIVKELRSNKLWKEPIVAHSKYLILKTLNMLETEKTLVTSNTTTNISGIRDSLPRLINRLKRLVGPEVLTILVVSGGHGSDGASGFTRKKLLDHKLYEETCKAIGVLTQSEPSAAIQSVHIDAHKDALLKNPLYKKIRFNVLNIKYFHKEGEGDQVGLLDYVRALNPNAIIIDWCYSKHADVANVLTKSGIVAEMWLKYERTSIVGMSGKGWIDLDDTQTGVLRRIIKHIDVIKSVTLVGGHGTGKTILGCEILKIKMAALKQAKEEYDLYCIDCGSLFPSTEDPRKEDSTLLDILEDKVFINQDSSNNKYFYTIQKLESESGIEEIESMVELLFAIKKLFEQENQSGGRKKVVLLDELPANVLFEVLDIEWDPNIYVVSCISPVIKSRAINRSSNERRENIDGKFLLETKGILFGWLDVTYRNSFDIQMCYNVFLAHLDQFNIKNILTGMMKQPQPNPDCSLSQNSNRTNLPSGSRPTFFINKKHPSELSNDEMKLLEKKVLQRFNAQDKSLSAICVRFSFKKAFGWWDKEECTFCLSINWQFPEKDGSNPKLVQIGLLDSSSGYRGCEQDNLIIHFDDVHIDSIFFESFSRARKNLIVISSKSGLEIDDPFRKTIRGLLKHEEKCENQKCKEQGWDKLKVIDVEYIGLTDDEVKELEKGNHH